MTNSLAKFSIGSRRSGIPSVQPSLTSTENISLAFKYRLLSLSFKIELLGTSSSMLKRQKDLQFEIEYVEYISCTPLISTETLFRGDRKSTGQIPKKTQERIKLL